MSEAGPGAEIVAARFPQETEIVRTLFLEYAGWLDFDLCFQGFEAELAGLPGKYLPPAGGLWLAKREGQPVGVVALRPLDRPGICEMKRLWVRPAFRGHDLGRRLIEAAITGARLAGYAKLRLDTLPQMDRAQALYRKLGFREIAPYYDNPISGARYLETDLAGVA